MKGAPVFEPNVLVTDKCDRNCIYCSAKGEDRRPIQAIIKRQIAHGFKSLVFEGGEPLLCGDLERLVRSAVKKGVSDIHVMTNGRLLNDERLRSLRKAGVDHFQFNFPSHLPRLYDLMTGTKGKFTEQVGIIRNTIASGPEAAIICCVMNSVNYRTLPQYTAFLARELGGVFYVAFNFLKVKGMVKKHTWLVPKLADLTPYLREAINVAEKNGLRCIVDGLPLCAMKGFEEYARDISWALKGDKLYFGEKVHVGACRKCGLRRICIGPRQDYLELYGAGDIHASRKKEGDVIRKMGLKGRF